MSNSNNNLNSDSDPGLVILYPDPNKCLGRVPSLSKVDGLESSEIELLNNWFASQWKVVYSSGFVLNESVTRGFTEYLQANSFIAVDLDKVDSYLSVQKLLYNGLRLELVDNPENVSQCKLFHRYYYSCRENPTSLNNPVVLSNVIWSMKKYKRDEFALTCLVDVLLQSYMVALDSFISLGGVTVIRETFEFMARNSRLKYSTKFLLKCMDLLDKLDINLEILQTSRIGVHVNSIALAKSNPKCKLDYECGDDKVKLKATNLIKKWKAIRDASMPNKNNNEELRMKKQPLASPDKRLERQNTLDTSPAHETEGSFVLNIINTMAEQKEREKKRKLEIRNSQMGSKFKSKLSEEKNETDDTTTYTTTSSSSGTNANNTSTSKSTKTSTGVDSSKSTSGTSTVTVKEDTKDNDRDVSTTTRTSDTSSDRVKRHKTSVDYGAKDSSRSVEKTKTGDDMDRRNKLNQKHMESKEEKKSSDNQLASLMNFFKEYSNKTEDKKSSLHESPVKLPHQQSQTQVAPVSFQPHLPTMVVKPKPPSGPPPLTSMVNPVPPPNLQMGSGMLPGSGAGPGVPGPGVGPVPNLLEPPMDGRNYPPNEFRGNFQDVPQPMFNTFPLLGQALPPGFIPPPPPTPPPGQPGHPPFQNIPMDAMGKPNPGVVPPLNYNFEFQTPSNQLYKDNQFGFYPMAPKKLQPEEYEENPPPPWK